MCCSVWGQLKMFNSDTRARTLERLHTQASRERKGKQWCRSLQLADWPKGFTLKLSQRAREGGREGETAGVREGRGGGRNEEGKNSVIEEKKKGSKAQGFLPSPEKDRRRSSVHLLLSNLLSSFTSSLLQPQSISAVTKRLSHTIKNVSSSLLTKMCDLLQVVASAFKLNIMSPEKTS